MMREGVEYPTLIEFNPKNIPEQGMIPIASLINKDESNFEPSDRVRILQIWGGYLFLLVKANTAQGKGEARKIPTDWEVFY